MNLGHVEWLVHTQAGLAQELCSFLWLSPIILRWLLCDIFFWSDLQIHEIQRIHGSLNGLCCVYPRGVTRAHTHLYVSFGDGGSTHWFLLLWYITKTVRLCMVSIILLPHFTQPHAKHTFNQLRLILVHNLVWKTFTMLVMYVYKVHVVDVWYDAREHVFASNIHINIYAQTNTHSLSLSLSMYLFFTHSISTFSHKRILALFWCACVLMYACRE